MEEYEDKLESDFYMDMDPVHRLGERFPWLDTVDDIADRPGLLPLGTPLRLRSSPTAASIFRSETRRGCGRWEESSVLAELEPWFELAEKPPVPEHNAPQG